MWWRGRALQPLALIVIGLGMLAVQTKAVQTNDLNGIQETLPEYEHGRPAQWFEGNLYRLSKEHAEGRPRSTDRRVQLAVLKPGRCIAVKVQAPAGSQIEVGRGAPDNCSSRAW
jgi:hypothetical protein